MSEFSVSLVLTNTLLFALWCVAYTRILTRRFAWKATFIGFALWYVLFLIPPLFMTHGSGLRMGYGMAVMVLFPLLLYRDKWYKTLFCVFIVLVIMSVSDLISVTLPLTPEQLREGVAVQPLRIQLVICAICLSFNALLLWTFTLLMNRYRLSTGEWLLYLTFPASQYLLLCGWAVVCRTDFNWSRVLYMLGALLVCLLADVSLFAAIRNIAQRSELKAKNDLLAQQVDRQKEHYETLTAQYDNIRRMRHDIASHLYTMESLLKQGNSAEAARYFSEIAAACQYQSDLGSCENPAADAFLYARTRELTRQGYALSIQVQIPAEPGVRSSDLIVALGNLLDNAVESCRLSGCRKIALTALTEKGYLILETQNPAAPADSPKKRRIPELERGVGFRIFEELAARYDGRFSHSLKDGVFTTSLFLKSTSPDLAERNDLHAPHCSI